MTLASEVHVEIETLVRGGFEDEDGIQGYCFFHSQDLDRAVKGFGLNLAFGPTDPQREESDGPRIGRRVVAALERAGLRTEWSGTFDRRICIPAIRWQQR